MGWPCVEIVGKNACCVGLCVKLIGLELMLVWKVGAFCWIGIPFWKVGSVGMDGGSKFCDCCCCICLKSCCGWKLFGNTLGLTLGCGLNWKLPCVGILLF